MYILETPLHSLLNVVKFLHYIDLQGKLCINLLHFLLIMFAFVPAGTREQSQQEFGCILVSATVALRVEQPAASASVKESWEG